jgi:phosphatidylserine decarboxylase
MTMKFAPEGYPFILVFGIATAVVASLAGPVCALPPLLLTLFMCYFFRDPERDIPSEKDVFVSPADGRVFLIRDVQESKYLHRDVREISIFMSPLDVHVNRAPSDGTVKMVQHNKGRFAAAYKENSSFTNENIEVVLQTSHGDILVRQVAGFVARRAVCRKKEGDTLARGERYGMIKFSSRLDIYLPQSATLRVKVGDRVRAGETILAKA